MSNNDRLFEENYITGNVIMCFTEDFVFAGLSYNETLLPILWRFLSDLGPNCGLKVFLEMLSVTPDSTIHPVFSLLTLFCEAASNYIW